MDEFDETVTPTAGERLRAAREEKGLSLEDVAGQTRIPRRHLESLETSDWSKLPAPTYTIGFAKSYASAVGADRTEIGDQLRTEMGGSRTTRTIAANAPNTSHFGMVRAGSAGSNTSAGVEYSGRLPPISVRSWSPISVRSTPTAEAKLLAKPIV